MPHNSKCRLVIDANVARSAGPEQATHPTSKKCRDFLLAVEKHDFSIVSTFELRKEWNRHQSGFFRAWRAKMMGRKRIVSLNVVSHEIMRNKLVRFAANDDECKAMLKDCHLLEAALESDQRIISCEILVRKHFSRACLNVNEICRILWVNPTDDDETIFVWLTDGAPESVERHLENYIASRP